MQNITNFKSVKFVSETQTLSGTFLGPLNIRGLIQSPSIEGETLAILENNRVSLSQLTNVLIIPLILSGSLLNCLLINNITQRISRRQLPWLLYLIYIILLDQFDLMLSAIDFLVESYHEIRLVIVLQFLGRFYCQILPMFYSLLKHLHSGLFILLTIETLKLTYNNNNNNDNNPLKQLNAGELKQRQRKQVIQNTLIFISVIIITLNCQFIWTFDISQLEMLILHGRIVHNLYKCDFAMTSVLSPTFLYYIWPLFDHICGDILPCLICLSSGLVGYILYRCKVKRLVKRIENYIHEDEDQKVYSVETDVKRCKHHGEEEEDEEGQELPQSLSSHLQEEMTNHSDVSQLFNVQWSLQIIRVFILFCFIHGVFLLPRCLYYLTKYFLFISRETYRSYPPPVNGPDDMENHAEEEDLFNKISQIIESLKPYEVYLESYETALRYSNFFEVHIRAIILLFGIEEFRTSLYAYFNAFIQYIKRFLCYMHKKMYHCCRKQTHRRKCDKSFVEHNGSQMIHEDSIEMMPDVNKVSQYHCSDLSNSNNNNNVQSNLDLPMTTYVLNNQATHLQNSSIRNVSTKNIEMNTSTQTITSNIRILNINSKWNWNKNSLKQEILNVERNQFNTNSNNEQTPRNYKIIYL
ncbi:unnamed protein product [Trichobilharzia regenti]|nr:unnamed protein product [Trichobilharzia regenti]